ncbi:MAG: glycosyltransferase family A protein [Methylococcales bacterium]|nr:glycosyltransferase family A protein [Methylococcales bacterium]
MTISVIIPTYNRCELLQRALQSVLAQTTPALDIIVVDDGSEDTTAQMLAEQFPQVAYYYQENAGVSAARNLGIQHAKGDWIALLDSDDVWHPQKLNLQKAALTAASDYRISHTDEIWIRNGVQVNPAQKYAKQGGWMFQHCLPVCALSPSTVLIHRDVFSDVGLFDTRLPACEDYDLWLRISARYPVLLLNQALSTKYGGHADQLSHHYPGLDQYRVQALSNIIDSTSLSAENHQAALSMLLSKARIYQQGAIKRGRLEESAHYQHIIDHYANTDSTAR